MIVFDMQKSLSEISGMIRSYSIYLTGSRNSNCFTNDSDLDLIIVSDDFKEMNHDVRRKMFVDVFIDLEVRVDTLCLTSSEFAKFMSNTLCFSVIPIQLGGDLIVS